MTSEEKKSNTPAADQSQANWLVALNLLNKYLPDDFPQFDSVEEGERIGSKWEALVIQEESGVNVEISPKDSKEDITNRYIILRTFAKDFSGDPDKPFWLANLPFIFVVALFVKRYAGLLLKSQMREILRAFKIKKRTIDSYVKKSFLEEFSEEYLDAKVDQFIMDFKSHTENKINLKRHEFSLAETEKATGLSRTAIRNLVDEPRIEKAGIIISVVRELIMYQPHFQIRKY